MSLPVIPRPEASQDVEAARDYLEAQRAGLGQTFLDWLKETLACIAIVMILLHGTTRVRAERILLHGPDPQFQEPGGQAWDDGFSMNIETGPFLFGTPEDYARGKARKFPNEGGPVILVVDVPDDIVQRAANDWFPLSQGLVQFDPGAGLEELITAWPTLTKEIRSVP